MEVSDVEAWDVAGWVRVDVVRVVGKVRVDVVLEVGKVPVGRGRVDGVPPRKGQPAAQNRPGQRVVMPV